MIRLIDPPAGLRLKPGGPDLRTAITFAPGLVGPITLARPGDGGGRLWMSGPLGLSSASAAELNGLAETIRKKTGLAVQAFD